MRIAWVAPIVSFFFFFLRLISMDGCPLGN